jgi:hypothetical protein
MRFKVGEKVSFLHEAGWGIIQEFKENAVIVEDETGFERPILLNELVKIHGDHQDTFDDVPLDFSEKDVGTNNNKISQIDDTRKFKDFWEIDLHIHELLDSDLGLTNAEMLRHQMSVLKSFYRNASDKRIRKLIIIHGVGQGVLKSEVRSFLKEQEGIEFYDADFREYGKGATTVELFYR